MKSEITLTNHSNPVNWKMLMVLGPVVKFLQTFCIVKVFWHETTQENGELNSIRNTLNGYLKEQEILSHKEVKFDQLPMKSGIRPEIAVSEANLKYQEI